MKKFGKEDVSKTIESIFAIAIIVLFAFLAYNGIITGAQCIKQMDRAQKVENIEQQKIYIYINMKNNEQIEDLELVPANEDISVEVKELTNEQVINNYIRDICEDYKIDPYIVMAIIYKESRYQPEVSNGNHIGLMEVNKNIHAERCKKLGVDDLYDPYQNILVGVDLLNDIRDLYCDGEDDYGCILTCFNRGHAVKGETSSYSSSVISKANDYRMMSEGDLYGD